MVGIVIITVFGVCGILFVVGGLGSIFGGFRFLNLYEIIFHSIFGGIMVVTATIYLYNEYRRWRVRRQVMWRTR